MKLAAPVVHPDRPDQQLLRTGFVLDNALIGRMRDMHIEFLYVEFPSLDHLDKHLTVYLSPARQQVLTQIKQAIGCVQGQTRPRISYSDYCQTTRELITTLMEQGKNPIYLDQMARLGADAVAHGGAVAHLALLLGLIVEQRKRLSAQRAKDLVNLGVAGMLHDIGLSKLPEPLQKFSEADPPDNDKHFEEWKTHVRLGYEAIRESVEPTAAAAVLQHHQHFDGTGFPRLHAEDAMRGAMDGQRIHIFARILLCANLYDRLASPVAGQRRSSADVHLLLRRKYAAWIDPIVLSVLQQVVPPFAPGSRVKLSDGTRALVTDVDPANPFQPTVRRLAEGAWTPIDPPVDLRYEKGLAIDDPLIAELQAA